MENPLLSRAPTRQWGVTLVELLMVLAIGGIVLASAFPSLRDLILNTHRADAVNTLVADLHLVRSEAIKRDAPVTICKSPDGRTCVTSDGWEQGWLVFVDGDGDRILDAGEDVVRIREPLAEPFSVSFHAFGSRNYLRYLPGGTTGRNGSFYFCGPRGADAARAIILSKTGRLRVAETKSDGSPIDCP